MFMGRQKRIDEYGIRIGSLPKGRLNKITDVEGVRVGHFTIDTAENKTGVTVILPREGNIFTEKLIAAAFVLNGFGKAQGLVQIEELGTLETPIALTNTLNIGIVHDALVEYMVGECDKDGVQITSVNPVVGENNDSFLNNIRIRAVRKEHVFSAIESACEDFEEGDVGAGKGVSCHLLKGGIGSASRVVEYDGGSYTIGALVQTNLGLLEDLVVGGRHIGPAIAERIEAEKVQEKGSIMIVIATDLPVSSRQLKRLCKRASVGIARCGSYIGHGSGDIIIGFSTGNTIREGGSEIRSIRVIDESLIDPAFRAVAEAVEEAVLNSMITAKKVTGYGGHVRETLADYLEEFL
jgi:D-aminopeptidase